MCARRVGQAFGNVARRGRPADDSEVARARDQPDVEACRDDDRRGARRHATVSRSESAGWYRLIRKVSHRLNLPLSTTGRLTKTFN